MINALAAPMFKMDKPASREVLHDIQITRPPGHSMAGAWGLASGAVGLVVRQMKRGEAKLMIKDSLNKVAEFGLHFIKNWKKG